VDYNMTRRGALALLSATLVRAADRLPANKNVKWALGSNLWHSYFKELPFSDILDVMKDTGFIGLRVTQFPGILDQYKISTAELHKELDRRGLHVITISFNGQAQDAEARPKVFADAKQAMTFLKDFGANLLVVFSPGRGGRGGVSNVSDEKFKTMCDTYNQLGEICGEMGFRAGLHNHLGQMVQTQEEVDKCMAMTDPKLFWFSPDTAHLYMAGCDVAANLDKHRSRLMMMDYKDAKKPPAQGSFIQSIYDLGDGDIDFPACHRVLKSMSFKGWICVDLDTARKGPRVSYERCGDYVVNKLEPIYL
jgi:inosose dehydratase